MKKDLRSRKLFYAWFSSLTGQLTIERVADPSLNYYGKSDLRRNIVLGGFVELTCLDLLVNW